MLPFASKETQGNLGRADVRLQTFILTFTSFLEGEKKQCSSFIHLTGSSQTQLTSWCQSQKGAPRWAGDVRAAQRKKVGERGQSDGGMEVAGVCQEMTSEIWVCIIMVVGLSPPEARQNTLSSAHRRSWLQIDFCLLFTNQHSWMGW